MLPIFCHLKYFGVADVHLLFYAQNFTQTLLVKTLKFFQVHGICGPNITSIKKDS